VSVFGTPESLRILVATLQRAVESLPSAVSERQRVSDFYVGDADGSKQEVYLSFHAEPSLDYLAGRQKRKTMLDYLFVVLLVALVALAVIGVRTVWHWML
jgi:hypothetical protein